VSGVFDPQIYYKNLETGELRLVSTVDGTVGGVGNSGSWDPFISPDGKSVVFTSSATNLVSGVTGLQVYHKNLESEEMTLVSSKDGREGGDGDSSYPQTSEDGRKIVFVSNSHNLIGAGEGGYQIYYKNLDTGEVKMVSSLDGTVGTQSSGTEKNQRPQISADGSKVVFASYATNLPGLTGESEIYLKNLNTEELSLVSSFDGVTGFGGSYDPAISSDGTKVSFRTSAIIFEDVTEASIAVVDLETREFKLANSIEGADDGFIGLTGEFSQLSSDGSKILFMGQVDPYHLGGSQLCLLNR
jgi:Tol biopolymer transport system component